MYTKETIQKHSTNNTKHSKYRYTYYQNTHTIVKTPPHTHTHTLQNKLKQPQHKIHTKWNSHNTIKYHQHKVTLIYVALLSFTLVAEVSRHPIGPTYKGQVVQEDWPLKTEIIGDPETSVSAILRYVIFQTREGLIYTAANVRSAKKLLIIGIFSQYTMN